MAVASRMTVEQYLATVTEGDRSQLVDGRVVVNAPTFRHQQLQVRLLVAIHDWVRAGDGRGAVSTPLAVVIGDRDLYEPDVVWIAEGHLPGDPYARLERIPELCVEIRSPGTWRHDVGRKKAMYERGGLPELWLVDDRAETVLVFRRSRPGAATFDVAEELAGAERLTPPLLPGFALTVADLFA